MHYVVGDVHGCFFEFQRLMKKIQREDRQAKFILLGDLIDRGPDTVKMLQWCQKAIEQQSEICILLGNHELLFLDWCETQWFPYINGKTSEYIHAPYKTDIELEKAGILNQTEVQKIYDFLKSKPIVLDLKIKTSGEIQSYVIAHAWAKKEDIKLIREQKAQPLDFWKTFLLDRSGAKKGASYDEDGSEILIFGHTPTIDEEIVAQGTFPGTIHYNKNIINVDCGMCYESEQDTYMVNLGAICLESLKEYYAYTFEEWFYKKERGLFENSKEDKKDMFVDLNKNDQQLLLKVKEYKNKYHYFRPNMKKIQMIKQINGDRRG